MHDSYADLIDDASVDCVYVALPNALHFEWALRAARAGKHVLLEKPATANGAEARRLFESHVLRAAPNAPVVLEAFHHRFHPAWQTFLALTRAHPHAGPIRHVHCQTFAWKGFVPADDMRWSFELGGGCVMDFAAYNLSCLHDLLGDLHLQSADLRLHGSDSQVDEAVECTFTAGGGATATVVADMAKTGGWPVLPASWTARWPGMEWPKCVVECAPLALMTDSSHTVQRTVTLWNVALLHLYHSIDVEDRHTIHAADGQVVSAWTTKKTIKAYNWPTEDGRAHTGEVWWSTYRYQLEEFVNRIKGRTGSGVWIGGAESIAQMETIDEVYKKGGLQVRPTHTSY